jgi:hypothetical protein
MRQTRVATPAEVKRALELAAEGMSSFDIAKELGRNDRTVRDWLRRGHPRAPSIKPKERSNIHDYGTRVSALLEPEALERLDVVCQEQGGVPRSFVIRNAVELYLDAMDRLRGGSSRPLDVRGYRPGS